MLTRLTIRAVLLAPLLSLFAFSQLIETAPAQTTPVAPAPDGKAIFELRCAKCHGENGSGVTAAITIAGPSLLAEHDHGAAMTAMEVGPSHMPSFARVLSIAEMRAVADYVTQHIAVIPLSAGNLSDGGKLFRIYCAPCHRTAVRGGALAFTGVNAPALTEKSPALVAGAIRWGPGPMPSFPASVLDDKQLDSIVEYVKFVQHPPNPGGSSLGWYGPVAEGFAAWLVLLGVVIATGWIEKGGKG